MSAGILLVLLDAINVCKNVNNRNHGNGNNDDDDDDDDGNDDAKIICSLLLYVWFNMPFVFINIKKISAVFLNRKSLITLMIIHFDYSLIYIYT